jgi:hypothetical protein
VLREIVKRAARIRREMSVQNKTPVELYDLLIRKILFEEHRYLWMHLRKRRPAQNLRKKFVASHFLFSFYQHLLNTQLIN